MLGYINEWMPQMQDWTDFRKWWNDSWGISAFIALKTAVFPALEILQVMLQNSIRNILLHSLQSSLFPTPSGPQLRAEEVGYFDPDCQ